MVADLPGLPADGTARVVIVLREYGGAISAHLSYEAPAVELEPAMWKPKPIPQLDEPAPEPDSEGAEVITARELDRALHAALERGDKAAVRAMLPRLRGESASPVA